MQLYIHHMWYVTKLLYNAVANAFGTLPRSFGLYLLRKLIWFPAATTFTSLPEKFRVPWDSECPLVLCGRLGMLEKGLPRNSCHLMIGRGSLSMSCLPHSLGCIILGHIFYNFPGDKTAFVHSDNLLDDTSSDSCPPFSLRFWDCLKKTLHGPLIKMIWLKTFQFHDGVEARCIH